MESETTRKHLRNIYVHPGHPDSARVAPYVEILKIVIFCLINDLRRTFFKWTMETSIYDCLLHFAYFKDPY